jgi:hypothetical protein
MVMGHTVPPRKKSVGISCRKRIFPRGREEQMGIRTTFRSCTSNRKNEPAEKKTHQIRFRKETGIRK